MSPAIIDESAVSSRPDGGRVQIYELGEPLPTAVTSERQGISAEARKKIDQLMQRDPGRFLRVLLTSWMSIAAAVALAISFPSWWLSAGVVVFVATRQNVLGLLVHEQCHRLGFLSKRGDLLCNITTAYPLMITLEGYRRVHLAHHQNYFTDRDPDYIRKQGPEWTFPQKIRRLLKAFLTDLSGLSLLRTVRGKGMEDRENESTSGSRSVVRPAFYVTLVSVLVLTGSWKLFLLYWLLPLATVLQMIVRWGAICEHKYNLENPTLGESTPIIEPRWWESLLLPNLNFTLHVYHHWFPRVPFAKLPAVHEICRQDGIVNDENVFKGYLPYLAFLLGFGKHTATSTNESQVHG